jgi:BirA family transcriptional regulator, biotin operon repressor / biotin---[acetyl-CoA-carboxylase] ligase
MIIMIIGSKIIFRENLPSTNTYLGQLLQDKNLPEGTIVYTNYQSAGRGQSGNRWESEDGKNLLFSILIFPSMINPVNQFIISMAISLGICDFLERQIPGGTIKWPNDIYVNNDKIAGILIENSILGEHIEYSIAGIGLNINQVKFLSDAPNPVSLKLLTGANFDLKTCLSQLVSDLDKRYKQVISESFDQVRNDYFSKLYRVNKWSDFRDQDGVFSGRILSVTEIGKLQIEKKSGLRVEYSFKEIEFMI